MSMEWIRKNYKVPAKRGARVEYTDGETKLGTITGTSDQYIRIRMDGDQHTGLYHPTWGMRYLAAAPDQKLIRACDQKYPLGYMQQRGAA